MRGRLGATLITARHKIYFGRETALAIARFHSHIVVTLQTAAYCSLSLHSSVVCLITAVN